VIKIEISKFTAGRLSAVLVGFVLRSYVLYTFRKSSESHSNNLTMLTTLAFRTEEENFVLSLALYQTRTMFKTLFFALTAAAVAPAAIAQSFTPTLPPADFPAGKNRCELCAVPFYDY
jgi:hypothetical protein